MNQLSVFNFGSSAVRVVIDENGEPLFVGKDVCETLGYVNPSDAIGKHCKGVAKRYPLQTSGGTQEVRVLTESDVLRLIVSSKLPAAEVFERWVFEEVLPSIRKTGAYVAPGASGDLFPSAAAQDPRIALLAGLKAAGVLSSAGAEVASFRLLGLRPPQALMRAAAPVVAIPTPAPVQLPPEVKPQPKQKPAPFKLSPRRGRDEVNGVNFVLPEVASYCGVSLDDLARSMREHGLISETGGVVTAQGREFVAFTKRGSRHWKVGALMRHLSA